jgi:hypothetical protein
LARTPIIGRSDGAREAADVAMTHRVPYWLTPLLLAGCSPPAGNSALDREPRVIQCRDQLQHNLGAMRVEYAAPAMTTLNDLAVVRLAATLPDRPDALPIGIACHFRGDILIDTRLEPVQKPQ